MEFEDFSVFFIEFMKNMNILIDLLKFKNSMFKDFFDMTKSIHEDPNDFINTLVEKMDYEHLDKLKKGMLGDKKYKFLYNFFLEVQKTYTFENYIEFERINDVVLKLTEFEKYLYNCFKHIILKHPEILDSRTMTFAEFTLHSELGTNIVEAGAEKFLHELFYKNYIDVFKMAIKPLGIKHDIYEVMIHKLQDIKLIRNQLIHANGRVTTLFLKKLKALELPKYDLRFDEFNLNNKIELSDELLQDISQTLIIIGFEFDKKLTEAYPELKVRLDNKS